MQCAQLDLVQVFSGLHVANPKLNSPTAGQNVLRLPRLVALSGEHEACFHSNWNIKHVSIQTFIHLPISTMSAASTASPTIEADPNLNTNPL